jgi:hypothetical protein
LRRWLGIERVAGQDEVLDGLTGDEVFLDDAFEDRRRGGVIPDAFWIDDGDGTVFADAEAIGLGAEGGAGALGEAELVEAVLEEEPGGESDFLRAALRLGLVGAEEDVAAERADAELVGEFGDLFGRHVPTIGQVYGSPRF